MPTPLVSIIVTSYNHSAFLEEALDSVFNQTWKNTEVIIVDDASTDRSVDIIKIPAEISLQNDSAGDQLLFAEG